MKSIAVTLSALATFGLGAATAQAGNAPTSTAERVDLIMSACVIDGTAKEEMEAAVATATGGERMDLFTGYDTSTISYDDGVMIMAAATLDHTLQCAGSFPPGTMDEPQFHEFAQALGAALQARYGDMAPAKDMDTIYRWTGSGTKNNELKVQAVFSGGSTIINSWSAPKQ